MASPIHDISQTSFIYITWHKNIFAYPAYPPWTIGNRTMDIHMHITLCIFFRMIHEYVLFNVFPSITHSYIGYSSVLTFISLSETVLSIFFVSPPIGLGIYKAPLLGAPIRRIEWMSIKYIDLLCLLWQRLLLLVSFWLASPSLWVSGIKEAYKGLLNGDILEGVTPKYTLSRWSTLFIWRKAAFSSPIVRISSLGI